MEKEFEKDLDEQNIFVLNIIGNMMQVVERETMSVNTSRDNSDHLLALTACSRELVKQYMTVKYGLVELEVE